MTIASVLNNVWMWKCTREKANFDRSLSSVFQTQTSVLQEIVCRNRASVYGRRNQFGRIGSPREFQQRVPVADDDDFRPYVERIAAGESGILTEEQVRILEPTSGTLGAEKLIPYTDSLKRQFQIAVDVWIADLFRQRPAVRNGRAFWSISPATSRARLSAGGIPIGFEDDAEYLGTAEKRILRRLLAVPSSLAKLREIERFRYLTLLYLLTASDLSLISVWSPTYLTTLLQGIECWGDRLEFDVRHRTVQAWDERTRQNTGPAFKFPLSIRKRRVEQVLSILRSDSSISEKLRELWPQLALISCWTDAGAAPYVSGIRDLFPDVEIQPKGLLATEAFVSIPLLGRSGAALALRSHFFEFAEHECDSKNAPDREGYRLAHELDLGGRYQVLVTTGGGLYRYRMHDIVEVVGFEDECPLIRFVGKSNLVSDLVGEKVGETHVREVLVSSLSRFGVEAQFAMLTPVGGVNPRYRLYLQTDAIDRTSIGLLRETIQRALELNPHYRLATELKQLLPVEICILDPNGESAAKVFQQACIRKGQKLGDIKCTALARGEEWPKVFDPLTLFKCQS